MQVVIAKSFHLDGIVLNMLSNLGGGLFSSGTRSQVCGWNCDWQKWRDDQENTK